MSHKPPSPATGEISDIPRRSFFSRTLAFAVGGLVGLLPTPGRAVLHRSATRKKRAVGMSGDAIDPEGFIKVASEEALGELPKLFKVVTDLRDFWNKFPDTEVGAVYLRKDGDTITCFNARCPHLGCTVKFDDGTKTYACPCHASAFSLDGERTNSIPPRNLDALDYKVDADGMVCVKYQKFRAGTKDQVPV
jgi:Rieske Fe-S protein